MAPESIGGRNVPYCPARLQSKGGTPVMFVGMLDAVDRHVEVGRVVSCEAGA